VPNPSFEVNDTCPNANCEIRFAPPWFQPSIGTPDLFNECVNYPDSSAVNVHVPNNIAGYQIPVQNGKGYAGLAAYEYYPGIPYREYIETKLLQPLQSGIKYFVHFYLSLADSAGYATDDMGIYFSTDSLVCDTCFYFPVVPQIKNPLGNFLTDKNNWMLLSGSYIAMGGEQFITIGNFTDENSCDTISVPGGGELSSEVRWCAYYYIDAIYIGTDSSDAVLHYQLFNEPKIYYYDNSINILWANTNFSFSIKVFDCLGQVIKDFENIPFQKSMKIDCSDFTSGVYFVLISNQNNIISKSKIFINKN